MTNINDLIRAMINGCGTADVDYLIDLFNDWDVSPFDIDFSTLELNDIIYQLFERAAEGLELAAEDYRIYTNALDSHFYYKDEEFYDLESLTEFIEEEKF